ncbi:MULTISPECIES: PLP-dependent aminotransferase family protein [Tsukamurella]|uniref:Aminotransferase class I/II-fold pyridoxal phosphate-dependent enzyme n=2 Tax=Tsukamurella TaxID=2060 RepID=A0A5C5RX47_9ACTN|nr:MULTISPECIES: aminotransferase class I/II-fold pyridoxal phosphate-dependent enzyme [Tsukamurella]NMD58370.1 aminotransferase class I/II-fold pyridoxal phosphate-dependent enzyme [Tsukamurella columbiensis]TWS27647.1 aminotransferase class I/II-fold pyridoxal phosphate-dependent enzyme [Tsukamurella conjunctivitidis]
MDKSPTEPVRDTPALHIDDPSPAGIAGAIARMINAGELVPGDRLPTVRALSRQLNVSPATVSQGWQALARSGLVVSRGRSGTFVAEGAARRPAPASRTMTMAGPDGDVRWDLSLGAPDPRLLPEIAQSLGAVARRAETTNYHEHPVVPELGALLSDSWPTSSEALTIVDGALDAVVRAVDAVTRYGDRVIVENPTFPQFLDLLEVNGLHPLPVRLDEEGIRPDDFARALEQGPSAAIIQPRAQNPTGRSMSRSRAEELVRLLRGDARCMVIEDDHSGSVVSAGDLSLGQWIPERVLHIRSFSKSHGPDLRIAAMSGPAAVINRVVARRALGPGWTPRILQRLLYDLLSDATAERTVARARDEYARRRDALVPALAGIDAGAATAEGLNLWIPVEDERRALIHLAAEGIRVAPGTPFVVGTPDIDHIRVTIAPLDTDFADVGRAVATAAAPVRRDGFYALREL